MRVIFRKEPVGRFLKRSRRALFVCGILLLGYCGFALVDSWLFQRRASRNIDRLLRDRQGPSLAGLQHEQAAAPKAAPVALPDGLIGRLEIPRTALPGDAGNVGLAGHRDKFIRPLKDVKVRDEVRVSTLTGAFEYKVVSLRIVEPDKVGVLAPAGENVLTLVTCYPFYFVGPAPRRWIVRARQVSSPAVASLNMK
jgi:sortase A